MLRLELELHGERNIASKMCQYLPGKTNKQIRDKRAETTYMKQRQDLMSSTPEPSLDNLISEEGNRIIIREM
jgi:hypothetical protein